MQPLAAADEDQLEARFGTLPPTAVDRLAHADLTTLQRWSLRVLDATELDEALDE